MPRDYALKGTASWAKEKPEKAGEEHVLKVGIVIRGGQLFLLLLFGPKYSPSIF